MYELTKEDLIRFWSYIDKQEDHWIWLGGIRRSYGIFSLNSKAVEAHRISYFIVNKDLESSDYVHHKCPIRYCVNPDHLEKLSPEEHSSFHNKQQLCQRGHVLEGYNLLAGKQCRECHTEAQRRRRKEGRD